MANNSWRFGAVFLFLSLFSVSAMGGTAYLRNGGSRASALIEPGLILAVNGDKRVMEPVKAGAPGPALVLVGSTRPAQGNRYAGYLKRILLVDLEDQARYQVAALHSNSTTADFIPIIASSADALDAANPNPFPYAGASWNPTTIPYITYFPEYAYPKGVGEQEGSVLVMVDTSIDSSGSVTEAVAITEGVDSAFTKAAENAVRPIKFHASSWNGPTQFTVPIVFSRR